MNNNNNYNKMIKMKINSYKVVKFNNNNDKIINKIINWNIKMKTNKLTFSNKDIK